MAVVGSTVSRWDAHVLLRYATPWEGKSERTKSEPATNDALRYHPLAVDRYNSGIDSYLNVIRLKQQCCRMSERGLI